MINGIFFLTFIGFFIIVQTCGSSKFGTWFNPITLFCGLWTVTAAVSNLGLYGYFKPSLEVNLIMLTGVLVAFLLCMGINFEGASFKQDTECCCSSMASIRYWICITFCLTAIAVLVMKLPRALGIIHSHGWAYLRVAYYANPLNYDGPQYMSTADAYIQLYIVQPILDAALYLSVWLLFRRDRKAKLLFCLALVGQLLLVFISAGRGPLMSVFKVLILGLFSFSSKGQITSFLKQLFTPGRIIGTIAALIFLISVTAGRDTGEGGSLLQTLYQYYFTGPVFLSKLLQHHNPYWIPNETFMFGWATFGFIANVPLTFAAIFTSAPKTSVYWIASYLTSGNLEVGNGLYSNAMCTCFYDFIMDWGYVGAIIGPMLIIATSYYLIRKVQQCPSSPFFGCLMIYWLVLLIGTTFRWEAVDITPTCTIFFLWLFSLRNPPCNAVCKHQNGISQQHD